MAAPPGPRKPTRPIAVRNRERLIEASREVLAVRGFDAEIVEIAEASGLSVGTIYRNFPAKQDLFAVIVREVRDQLAGLVDQMAAAPDTREGIALLIRGGYEILERYGRLMIRLLEGNVPVDYGAPADPYSVGDRQVELFREGVRRGDLPEGLDCELAVAMLWALFAPRALDFLMRGRSIAELAESATAFYFRGFGIAPPQGA